MTSDSEERPQLSKSVRSHEAVQASASGEGDVNFRVPSAVDGTRMWEIARDSQVLDLNSSYAYVLWGAQFAATSVVVAESGGRVVGFVTGFRPQEDPRTIFVWQVAVDADQRGKRLAARMLHELFERLASSGVDRMQTTISPDNKASQKLFASVARDRGLKFHRDDFLSSELFPDSHEPEDKYTLGER